MNSSPIKGVKLNNFLTKAIQSDHSAKSDDYSLQIQVQKVNLKTHKNFDIKYVDTHNKIIMYIELCTVDLNKLIKDPLSHRSKSDDERIHIKNCIFYKKIETPNSHIKGSLYITFTIFKGLSFNIFLNKQSPNNNMPLIKTDKLSGKLKIIYDSDANLNKYITKCVQTIQKDNLYSWNVGMTELKSILQNKLLLKITFNVMAEPEQELRGIRNPGTLCYINSLIQILFHFIPFRKFIIQYQTKGVDQNKILKSLQQMFLELQTSKIEPTAQKLLSHFQQFSNSPEQQHDIHQFMISLFAQLQKEYPRINELWSGKDSEVVRSKNGKYESRQEQNFSELQIQIADCRGNSLQSLEQALKQLVKTSKVDELNTEEFGKLPAYKFRIFTELPPVLFMTIKRYEYNFKRKQLKKINLFQNYDYQINLNFMVSSHKKNPLNYVLYAGVVHKGRSPNSGHYFSFINLTKQPEHPKFYEFNDSIITHVRTSQILNEYTGKKTIDYVLNQQFGKWTQKQYDSEETTYMLVYILKEKFNEFQCSEYRLPTWHLERLQSKLTQQEAKTLIQCKFVEMSKSTDFIPFENEQEYIEMKLKRYESLEKSSKMLEPYLTNTIGSIWKVNIKARTIKLTGKKYGEKCEIILDQLCQYKRGFRQHDYFLIISKSQMSDLDTSQPLGIIHIEELTDENSISKIQIINKGSVDKLLEQQEKLGCNITVDKESLEYFKNNWNDYLHISKQ